MSTMRTRSPNAHDKHGTRPLGTMTTNDDPDQGRESHPHSHMCQQILHYTEVVVELPVVHRPQPNPSWH